MLDTKARYNGSPDPKEEGFGARSRLLLHYYSLYRDRTGSTFLCSRVLRRKGMVKLQLHPKTPTELASG